jgi:microcystin degradation protein MlrC
MKTIRTAVLLGLTICVLTFASCGKEEKKSVSPDKIIAVAEIMQETNSFSPVLTTRRDFEAENLVYGDAIIQRSIDEGTQIAGFLEAVEDFGEGRIKVVPIIKATSMSGGPVKRALYESFKKRLISGLSAIDKLHGIYLSMHGAMGVEGMRDPEGDLLQAIRNSINTEIPIGVSYDLHANVTRRQVKNATFIVGYKTNPHRDHFDTGHHSGEILIKTVLGKVKPVMAFNKMRLLKGGGMTIDFLSPMREIFSWMDDVEDSDEVLCISNFMVHIWLDDPELGWSTVVVTDNKPALAKKLADELADRNWSVRDVKHSKGSTPSEAIEKARNAWFLRKFGTTVFCDVSDAVGAGAPGENTWILKALIDEGSDLTSYLWLRDRDAAREAYAQNIGESITLNVGGKLDKVYNKPVSITGTIISKTESRLGKTAILKHKGIHLVLSELPESSSQPNSFTDLGLSLWDADIVVVKNLFPFRYRYLLYNRKTVDVITPGTTNVDVFQLQYQRIPRPIYPLDSIEHWRGDETIVK